VFFFFFFFFFFFPKSPPFSPLPCLILTSGIRDYGPRFPSID
jgi:hypothetical protein